MHSLLPVQTDFPDTRYYPDIHLVTWHPQGVFDDEFADHVLAYIESHENAAEEPFHRFSDLTGLTDIRLKFGHAFRISQIRRANYPWREPVKSALYCQTAMGYGLIRMYASLMEGGPIQVRAFRTREAAAEWLEVPLEILLPEA